MADRPIYCTNCNCYLGVIRDAKLKKDIHHLCDNCNIKRIASDMGIQGREPISGDLSDMLKGMFK